VTKEPCVTPTPIRRRTSFAALVAVAAVLLALTGCTGQQSTPGSYDGAEDNFLEGCQEIATSDADADDATAVIANPEDYCACVWSELTNPDTGISFDRFKEVNSDLTENGGPLPDDFIEVYDRCSPDEGQG
jgi:hypothetical protein